MDVLVGWGWAGLGVLRILRVHDGDGRLLRDWDGDRLARSSRDEVVSSGRVGVVVSGRRVLILNWGLGWWLGFGWVLGRQVQWQGWLLRVARFGGL